MDSINKQAFKKVLWSSTDIERPIDCEIYFDKKKRIRKTSCVFVGGDSYATNLEYFDKSGQLIYLAFWESIYGAGIGKYAFMGNAYFYKGRAIKIDTSLVDELVEKPISKKNVLSFNYPKVKDRHTLSYHRTAKELRKDLRLSSKQSFQKGRYTFRKPKKGDKTIIISDNVFQQSKGIRKSKILDKLQAMTRVKTISVGKQESIGGWGRHKWYQVKPAYGTKGWVFGAFLEPVEVKIN